MNSSLALLQKIKNIALAESGLHKDIMINFPLFAYPTNSDDFIFLENKPLPTGPEELARLRSKYQFALVSNALPKGDLIWDLDTENLLYNNFKRILNDALLFNLGKMGVDETKELVDAGKLLYDGEHDTDKYTIYKTYRDQFVGKLEKDINNKKMEINTWDENSGKTKESLQEELQKLTNDYDDSMRKWIAVGNKFEIENALRVIKKFNSIDGFIREWQDNKNNMNLGALTDPDTTDLYFETSCTPNDFFQFNSKAWQTFKINKNEIATLITQYVKEFPESVSQQFGTIDVQLDNISFEMCVVNVIRPWFKSELLMSSYWTLSTDSKTVSNGDDNFNCFIPAYPIQLIFIKNVSFDLTQVPANDEVKKQLIDGLPVFFGPLLLKSIPQNRTNDVKSIRPQSLTENQLKIIVSKQNVDNPVSKSNLNKARSFEMLNAHVRKTSINLPPARETIALSRGVAPKPTISPMMSRIMVRAPIHPVQDEVKFKISGQILSTNQIPVGDVEIVLQNQTSNQILSRISDVSGSYIFQNLEKGNYHITASKVGFKKVEKDVNLNSDILSNFVLEPDKIVEDYFLIAVINKRLPKLPNPIQNANYI